MTPDERRDRILLFAAGLLDEDQAAEVRAELEAGGVDVGGWAAEARDLLTDLALVPDPVEPHASVKARLLRRVREDGRAARPQGPLPDRAPVVTVRRGAWTWPRAAALAAVAAGLGALLARQIPVGPPPELAVLTAERADLQEEIAALRESQAELDGELGDIEDEMRDLDLALKDARDQVAMLRKPGIVTVSLAGTERQPEASGRIFWDFEDGYYCYLHASGLTRAGAGARYALWLDLPDGDRILVGEFEVDPAGDAVLWATLPIEAGDPTGALVTLEPGPAADAPAGPVQLRTPSAI